MYLYLSPSPHNIGIVEGQTTNWTLFETTSCPFIIRIIGVSGNLYEILRDGERRLLSRYNLSNEWRYLYLCYISHQTTGSTWSLVVTVAMSQGVASTEPVSTVKVRSPADVTSLYSVPYWTLPSQELPSLPVTFSLNNREFLFLQSLKYKIKLKMLITARLVRGLDLLGSVRVLRGLGVSLDLQSEHGASRPQ